MPARRAVVASSSRSLADKDSHNASKPACSAAPSAAFHLGQLAFDGRGAYADAEREFATYLALRPRGPLAAEALGRMMEAQQRSGDLAGARISAARYLALYPTGAHARLAKGLSLP